MKGALTVLMFAVACVQASAQKFAFIYDAPHSPEQSAILTGAKEAAQELTLRYQSPLEVVNITPSGNVTASSQAQALRYAAIEKFSGALLKPAAGASNELWDTVRDLSARGFFIVVIGPDSPEADQLGTVSTDSEDFSSNLWAYIQPKTEAPTFEKIVLFSKSETTGSRIFNKENFPPLCRGFFEKFEGGGKFVSYFGPFLSWIFDAYGDDLRPLDNYGVIICDGSLLLDMKALPKDADRKFTVCLGGGPHLLQFLKTGQLDILIKEDYYGFGYVGLKALAEKVKDGKNPRRRIELLPAAVYTPAEAEKFEAEWLKLLKY